MTSQDQATLTKKERREILVELYNSVFQQQIANEVNGILWQRRLILDALIPAAEIAKMKTDIVNAEKNIKSLDKTLQVIDEMIKKEDEPTKSTG